MRRGHSNLLWAAAIWAFFQAACATGGTERLTVETKDSGINYGMTAGRMFWLDDQRVMFVGWDGTRRERRDGYKAFNHRLYIWNVESGKLEDRGPSGEGSGLCYHEGFVRYWRWKDPDGPSSRENRQWYAGSLGEEKPEPQPDGAGSPIYELTCRTENELPELPEWAKGRMTNRLKPEHGFLSWEHKPDFADKPYEVRFHRPDDPTGVVMPFRTGEFGYRPRYFGFKKAYLVVEWQKKAITPPPPSMPKQRLWWLYLDGRTEEIQIPRFLSSKPDDSYQPTVKGMVIRGSTRSRADGKLGDAGFWLTDGPEQYQLIANAHIERATVSPDGCKIVYTHDPYDTYRRVDRIERITIHVLNLCKGD